MKMETELSAAELKQLLLKKEKEEQAELKKEKADYMRGREDLVESSFDSAIKLSTSLEVFKNEMSCAFEVQKEKLDKYGMIKTNSKGGFTIKNSDDTLRISRVRATDPSWDERGDKAVELISSFLQTTVKKRDIKVFEILMTFISRNKNQDLEYSKVMGLLAHEDKFDHPEWKEGLRLLKESYSINLKKYHFEFKRKNENGDWERIGLNFSSL